MPSLERHDISLQQLQTLLDGKRQPKLTDNRFDKSHECFERSSDQQRLILQWLKEFTANFSYEDSLNILSVGCGSGILDNPLISSLAELNHAVDYTGIDPNPVACKRFRDEFDALQLSKVALEVREETVESLASDKRFDIIHAVHSLYYFEDPVAAIKQLLSRLNTGGKLVIFQAPKAELNQLAECFWFHDQDVDIWFSEELEQHLDSAALDYAASRIDGRVDVASCFDPSSERGAMVLDFVTQVDCLKLEPTARKQLLGYLNAVAECDGDEVLVPHPVDVFEISAAA